jgi:site-specific DNA-cytosine methylase
VRVLIACEFSGIVRDAFDSRGHYAVSCDVLPCEKPGRHEEGDIFAFIESSRPGSWDLMIAFPPCTHLAVSGARWFGDKRKEQRRAMRFFYELAECKEIPRVAVENPIGIMSTQYRRPDQIIQPWQFGHGETKATCLWLKGLPLLVPTNIVDGRKARVHREPPGPERWKNRSRTYQGVADAMAEQWGGTT